MPQPSPQSLPIRVCQVMGAMDGDAWDVVMDYYRHMDRDRVQFDFIATSDSRDIPQTAIEVLGGRVYLIPSNTRPERQAHCYRDLFLEHYEWDIVHAHLGDLSAVPLGEAARSGIHVRIAHAHGFDASIGRGAGGSLWRHTAKWATIHMASSEDLGRLCFGSTQRVTVMPDAALPKAARDLQLAYEFLSGWAQKYSKQ